MKLAFLVVCILAAQLAMGQMPNTSPRDVNYSYVMGAVTTNGTYIFFHPLGFTLPQLNEAFEEDVAALVNTLNGRRTGWAKAQVLDILPNTATEITIVYQVGVPIVAQATGITIGLLDPITDFPVNTLAATYKNVTGLSDDFPLTVVETKTGLTQCNSTWHIGSIVCTNGVVLGDEPPADPCPCFTNYFNGYLRCLNYSSSTQSLYSLFVPRALAAGCSLPVDMSVFATAAPPQEPSGVARLSAAFMLMVAALIAAIL
jgi:hypothetical protein